MINLFLLEEETGIKHDLSDLVKKKRRRKKELSLSVGLNGENDVPLGVDKERCLVFDKAEKHVSLTAGTINYDPKLKEFRFIRNPNAYVFLIRSQSGGEYPIEVGPSGGSLIENGDTLVFGNRYDGYKVLVEEQTKLKKR